MMSTFPTNVSALLVVRDFLRRYKMYAEADVLRDMFSLMHLSLCDDRNGCSILVFPRKQQENKPTAVPRRERDNARSRNKIHRRQRRKDVKSRGRDFAEWILDTFDDILQNPCDIIDVAGGKGDVTYQLATNTSSDVSCAVIDPAAFRLTNNKTKAVIKAAHSTPNVSQNAPVAAYTWDITSYDESQYHPVLWKLAMQMNDVRVLWLDWYGVIFPQDNPNETFVEEQVQLALRTLTSLRISHLRDYFTFSTIAHLSTSSPKLLIALHPDEATEDAVDSALAHRVSFAIVPCCVFPSRFPDRVISTIVDGEKTDVQVRLFDQFLDYLQLKHHNMRRATIDTMLGPNNIVLYMLMSDYT